MFRAKANLGFSSPCQRMTTGAGSLARTTETLGLHQWSISRCPAKLACLVRRGLRNTHGWNVPTAADVHTARASLVSGPDDDLLRSKPGPTTRRALKPRWSWKAPGAALAAPRESFEKHSGPSWSTRCSALLGSGRCKVSDPVAFKTDLF